MAVLAGQKRGRRIWDLRFGTWGKNPRPVVAPGARGRRLFGLGFLTIGETMEPRGHWTAIVANRPVLLQPGMVRSLPVSRETCSRHVRQTRRRCVSRETRQTSVRRGIAGSCLRPLLCATGSASALDRRALRTGRASGTPVPLSAFSFQLSVFCFSLCPAVSSETA